MTDYRAPAPYDAVTGRHILIHAPDPLAALQHCVEQVKKGGIVAFHEYDLSRYYPTTPPKPLWDTTPLPFNEVLKRAGTPDIGVHLFAMFHQLRLTNVESRIEIKLDGGADSPFYEWLAETVRTVLPALEKLGIATAEQIDCDTLAARLREEAVRVGGYVVAPAMIGTSGRRPISS